MKSQWLFSDNYTESDVLFKFMLRGNRDRVFNAVFVIIALIVAAFSNAENIHAQVNSENQTGQTNDSAIGYILPKTTISVRQTVTSPFKPLKHGGIYQSLGKTADGFLIFCELLNGQKAIALMPFKDGMGYKIVINERDNDQVAVFHPLLTSLDTVKIKPAEVTLEAGRCYVVIEHSDEIFTLLIASGTRACVEIASTNAEFLLPSDYQKKKTAVLAALRRVVEDRLNNISKSKRQDYEPSSLIDVIRDYSGELANETLAERTQLAKEYTKALSDVLDKNRAEALVEYEANQKAKGLVQFGDRWITPEQAQQEQQERKQQQEFAAEQQAKGLVEYNGQWMSREDAARADTAAHQCPRCRGRGVLYFEFPFPGVTSVKQEISGPSPNNGWTKEKCPVCGGTGRR